VLVRTADRVGIRHRVAVVEKRRDEHADVDPGVVQRVEHV